MKSGLQRKLLFAIRDFLITELRCAVDSLVLNIAPPSLQYSVRFCDISFHSVWGFLGSFFSYPWSSLLLSGVCRTLSFPVQLLIRVGWIAPYEDLI